MSEWGVTSVERLRAKHVERGKLNVLIFGPGRGEAIVVVLPNDEVGVVDGCAPSTDAKTGAGNPVHEFIVEWMKAWQSWARTRRRRHEWLHFACVTHMHEDHYLGLDAVLAQYPPRRLWRTSVVSDLDLEAAARAAGLRGPRREALHTVLTQLESFLAKRANQVDHKRLEWDAGRYAESIGDQEFCLIPVGPPPADVLDANAKLRNASVRWSGADPNKTSGALLLSWGKARVLLAGDLLASAVATHGWGPFRDGVKLSDGDRVQLVNVAHHGSEGAHDAGLWKRMRPEIAVVTPFQHATAKQPPQRSDLERLAASGSKVFVTSPPDWSASAPSKPVVPGARRDRSDPRNAVLVALEHSGSICKVVLAGKAFEHALSTPTPPAA